MERRGEGEGKEEVAITRCFPLHYYPAPNSLQAKFEVQDGPSTPKPAAVQFVCDGVTLSGVGLELIGSGYRLSLLKFKSISGQCASHWLRVITCCHTQANTVPRRCDDVHACVL